jgi:hypothetical protein
MTRHSQNPEIAALQNTLSKRVRPPPERRVYVLPAQLVHRILSHGKAQATEVATLRAPATDEALVEVAATKLRELRLARLRRFKERLEAGLGTECPDDLMSDARAVLAAVGPALVAAERERCASLEGAVMTSLSANGSVCACGNGRVPVTAYGEACRTFAAAIRAGATDAR